MDSFWKKLSLYTYEKWCIAKHWVTDFAYMHRVGLYITAAVVTVFVLGYLAG